MPGPGSGGPQGPRLPLGRATISNPRLQPVVRPVGPLVAPTASASGRALGGAVYTDAQRPQAPTTQSGGFMGWLGRVFGGRRATSAKVGATPLSPVDVAKYFGFAPEALGADARTVAIPIAQAGAPVRAGATRDDRKGTGHYESTSPRASGATAPSPVVRARSGGQDRVDRSSGHTLALPRKLPPPPAPVVVRPRPQPSAAVSPARAEAGRTASTPAVEAPSIERMVADIRLAQPRSPLTFDGRLHRTHGVTVEATQPGLGGAIRITADTRHAPVAEALQEVIGEGLAEVVFGQKDVKPALKLAVIFMEAADIQEAATARGIIFPNNLEMLVLVERETNAGTRATPGTRIPGTRTQSTNVGNIAVIGDLSDGDFSVDHQRVPQVLVFIPWSPSTRYTDTPAIRSALARLRVALQKIRAALPANPGQGNGGGGQGRRR